MTKDEDPWAGWPDTPWLIDGYLLDDTLCDALDRARRHGNTDTVNTLDNLIESLRARSYDKKEEND